MAARAKAPKRKARTKKVAAPAKKRAADEAASRAQQAGAVGSRLSAAKIQLRNAMILARVAEGRSYPEIAAEAKVSKRTVEKVVHDAREVRSPLEDAPMQLLDELATGHRRSIADFEAMSAAWFEVNQSASLGAKKAADETRARLATLMRDVGKLPGNLETFRSEMEMVGIAREMSAMMRQVAAGEASPEEAVEFFRRLIGQKPRLQLVEKSDE